MNDDFLTLFSDDLTRGPPARTGQPRPHARGRTHQEKLSICQNDASGSTKLKSGIARMYTIIQPAPS